ncbi:hypothetical protein ACYSNW_16145 [Enterococcus sp. LJL99]
MEISISKIGKIIEHYYKIGYFESDSLKSAIEKMVNDSDTGLGITVQLADTEPFDEVTLNMILEEIFDSL